MEKIVLSYSKLANFVGDNSLEKSKALKNLKEIRAEYSPMFVKKLGDFLDMPFSKLYDGINLDIPEDLDLIKLHKEFNIIFVPNHQSHADYMALNYAIHGKYNNELPVHIAGGINLNIFPIGTMFRKSGCFFIRRSFTSDLNYKNTFEAYLFYLLKQGFPIEFFFEGGRSRTGKLLPPRYGLFTMLLTAQKELEETDSNARKMIFIPISIMHEFVPEEKALIKELEGRKKSKESSTQLLKLFKLLKKELGTIHIKIGQPLENPDQKLNRINTQKLAFKCYRAVGKGMSVTPISLLSLILLDEPSGALTLEQILDKADIILEYCEKMEVPFTNSLSKQRRVASIKRALELLIQDKKLKVLEKKKLHQTYYVVEGERRMELLYFKNTLLHHFLVPYFMNSMLINILNGNLTNLDDLKRHLKVTRDTLKYEFYLPEIKEVIQKSLYICNLGLGDENKVETIEESLHLAVKDFFKIARFIGGFTRAYSYIFEGYYVGALTIQHFDNIEFNQDEFLKTAKEIHDLESGHGRFIKFEESYSLPLLKNALLYFENIGIIRKESNKFIMIDSKACERMKRDMTKDLTDFLTFNVNTKY